MGIGRYIIVGVSTLLLGYGIGRGPVVLEDYNNYKGISSEADKLQEDYDKREAECARDGKGFKDSVRCAGRRVGQFIGSDKNEIDTLRIKAQDSLDKAIDELYPF